MAHQGFYFLHLDIEIAAGATTCRLLRRPRRPFTALSLACQKPINVCASERASKRHELVTTYNATTAPRAGAEHTLHTRPKLLSRNLA